MYEKILVPLNGSAAAEGALEHAVAVARETGAHIILLEAVQDSLAPVPEARYHVSPRQVYGCAVRGRHYLHAVAERLRREGLTVRCAVREGEAASAILSCARQEGVDLIIMETCGHHALGTIFRESVARKVAETTHRPVLIVKGAGGTAREEPAMAA